MVLSTHNYIDASGILPSYTHISFIIRCPELETKMDTNKGKSFETFDMVAPGDYFDLLWKY